MPLREQNDALQDQHVAFSEPGLWVGDQWSTDP